MLPSVVELGANEQDAFGGRLEQSICTVLPINPLLADIVTMNCAVARDNQVGWFSALPSEKFQRLQLLTPVFGKWTSLIF